ncbi:MAG: AAA family ATPase [Epsilonproteobacteria bacterium]|nr:AAA family ATPase [Campylobacterota bacterium]
MKIVSLKNINYKILKDFNLDFRDKDKILDLVVLAGVNGSGKTTILEFIYKKFKTNKFDLKGIIYFQYKKKKNKFNDSFIVKNHEELENIENKIIYLKAEQNNIDELKKSIKKYLKYLIFEKETSPKETYIEFNNFLQKVFLGMELSISFDRLDRDENIYFKNSFGDSVKIDDLSTGEKEILNKAFFFFVNETKNSIILIDEPEISLHPTWQSHILKVYKNLAKEFNNQVIIATHSPQLIASTPKESLIILTKENGKIEAKNYNAYGKDINAVLVDIMGVEYLRDIEVEKQISKVKDMIFEDNFQSSEFREEFKKLEDMLESDSIELSLIRLEIKRRENAKNHKN